MTRVRVRSLLVLSVVAASRCVAQTSPPNPRFDVASVKRLPRGTPGMNRIELRPAGFEANGTPMRKLISVAYEIPLRSIDASQETIGASGYYLPSYSISAKTVGPVPQATMRLMLQNLLAERFQLKCHKEARTVEVLALTVSKSGLMLKPADASEKPLGLSFNHSGAQGYTTIDRLTVQMNVYTPLQVVNQTGVDGLFYFVLHSRGEEGEIGPPLLNPSRAEERFRAALREVGLELTRRKMEVEHLVVDSMLVTPTEN